VFTVEPMPPHLTLNRKTMQHHATSLGCRQMTGLPELPWRI
jgi:hypothetical protein